MPIDMSTAVAIISCVVAAATAYLRLFVATRLNALKDELSKSMISRELHEESKKQTALELQHIQGMISELKTARKRST